MDILTRESLRKAGNLLLSAVNLGPYNDTPKLNLARLISDLSLGHAHGEDREALQEYAYQNGIQHPDPQRPFIPFSEFRDLTKGTAGAGGYLVSTETQEAIDILRPFSVTTKMGIMLETGLVGDQVIPKTTAKSTPYWLLNETSQVTASQPTLSQIALTPKSVGIVTNFSRQLLKQTNTEFFVRRELMGTVGTAIDQAVLNGSGASGQPLGLLNTVGIGTTTGTSLGQSGVVEMKRKVAASDAQDEAISFIGTPAVRELLEKRERATGSGFIWDRDMVASRPAYASTDVSANTLIAGAWPALYLGVWGQGFTVEINPFDPTHFKTGVIQARIIVSLDVAVLYPVAFCVSTSIT